MLSNLTILADPFYLVDNGTRVLQEEVWSARTDGTLAW